MLLNFTVIPAILAVNPCLSIRHFYIVLFIAFSFFFQGLGGSGSRNPNQAVDVIAAMLAKGFLLGKDAVSKAKEFDEKHDLSASAKSSVVNFDKNTGISEKLTAGTAVVNQQMKAVDEKYQVSEKTRAALAVAEEKVAIAGSALMKNRYILTGAYRLHLLLFVCQISIPIFLGSFRKSL